MIYAFAAFFFLLLTFFLTSLASALRRLERRDSKKQRQALEKRFFYKFYHRFLFPGKELEGWVFSLLITQYIARFGYAVFALYAFYELSHEAFSISLGPYEMKNALICVLFLFFLLFSFFAADYLPRIFGLRKPDLAIRMSTSITAPFILAVFPLTLLFFAFSKTSFFAVYFDFLSEPQELAKEEILEIIQEATFAPSIDHHDKKMIESVLSFRDRIAREVMVPRVNVFSLSCTTTVKEAATLLLKEGYSRTPVYRHTVDNIVGVLMYKDLLTKYMEYEKKGDLSILELPIESIQKNVLYAPETKKISQLLQEFRKKQTHLAIVVDEYGGTEGIVTIEDILEQIVGEISDEYDVETSLFIPQSDGSWIVDARMSILDAEEKLDVDIPQEGDYDTIGGYIFHRTGAIPSKGFIIHHDAFEMEVLRSNERCVEKVRIKPTKQ